MEWETRSRRENSAEMTWNRSRQPAKQWKRAFLLLSIKEGVLQRYTGRRRRRSWAGGGGWAGQFTSPCPSPVRLAEHARAYNLARRAASSRLSFSNINVECSDLASPTLSLTRWLQRFGGKKGKKCHRWADESNWRMGQHWKIGSPIWGLSKVWLIYLGGGGGTPVSMFPQASEVWRSRNLYPKCEVPDTEKTSNTEGRLKRQLVNTTTTGSTEFCKHFPVRIIHLKS